MSYRLVKIVMERATVRGAAWAVLISMAESCRDERTSRLGATKIAARTNLGLRTVKGAIKQLIETGHIRQVEKGGGRTYTSVYEFMFFDWAVKLDALPESGEPETVQSTAQKGAETAPDAPLETVQSTHETVQSVHETVQSTAQKGAETAHSRYRQVDQVKQVVQHARESDPRSGFDYSQKSKTPPSQLPSLELVAEDGKPIPDLAEQIVEDWNRTCEVIASEHLGKPTPTPVTKITPARRERIAALLPVIGGQPEWRDAFNRLRRDPWWRGSERRVKPLTFDELTTARNGRDAPIIEISELDNAPRDAIDAAVANGHFSQREAAFQRELARLDGDEPARRGELETVDECGF